MKKYAKILDDEKKLVSVVVSENPDVSYFKSIGFRLKEVEQDYAGNWYLAGYAPKKPLNEIKAEKRSEINSERDNARKTEGAEYDGDLFDIDEVSQSNILAQIKVAEIIGDPNATYNYRSKTNTDHLLTLAQLQELGLAIAVKVNAIYVKSWDLKAQVDKATTAEEVEAINW